MADDKEPKWSEDGAALLARSKAYKEDWHSGWNNFLLDNVPHYKVIPRGYVDFSHF